MNVKLLTITAIVASSALISACGGETPKNTTVNAAKPANTTTTTAPANVAPTNAAPTNAPAANAPATNAAKPANAPADMKKDNAATSMKDGDAKKDAANTTAPKEGEKKP
jgi:hypothetical protein